MLPCLRRNVTIIRNRTSCKRAESNCSDPSFANEKCMTHEVSTIPNTKNADDGQEKYQLSWTRRFHLTIPFKSGTAEACTQPGEINNQTLTKSSQLRTIAAKRRLEHLEEQTYPLQLRRILRGTCPCTE
jgi:hypothetical protein